MLILVDDLYGTGTFNCLTIHEYAHALTADAMGDPTPRYLGRLTFNPLAHLDILGAIMLALFHFGWAKPVAINPNNFRNRREGMIKVSLAGPAANLIFMFSGGADYGFHAEIACFNPRRQRVFTVDYAVQRMVCLF